MDNIKDSYKITPVVICSECETMIFNKIPSDFSTCECGGSWILLYEITNEYLKGTPEWDRKREPEKCPLFQVFLSEVEYNKSKDKREKSKDKR